MELTLEQKMSIERLYENESLTNNLTDDDAKALLDWAQQQIIADTDGELVKRAVSAANSSGEAGAQTLLAQANTFLARANADLTGFPDVFHRQNPVRSVSADDAAAREAMRERKAEEMGAISTESTNLETTGQIGDARILTAHADASIAPASAPTPALAKKARRKTKRGKKK